MAEITLVVIQKIAFALGIEAVKGLGSQIGVEVSTLQETENRMKQIQSEFKVMQVFLRQAQMYEETDEALVVWLAEIKQLAFEMEDVIDEYTYSIGEQPSGFNGFLKRTFRKTKNVAAWYNIANQLKDIQTRLQNLSDIKVRYNINVKGESSTSSNIVRKQPPGVYVINQDDFVGFEEERNTLLRRLLTGKSSRTTIVSVCGMGGSGKTTLVHNVYRNRDITQHFDVLVWISVSQSYQIVEIMRTILLKLLSESERIGNAALSQTGTDSYESMVETIRGMLQEMRCLIVLDDVWSREIWLEMNNALVDNKRGSRVVITTRIMDVAKLASQGNILELQPLPDEKSWELFRMWAFQNNEDRSCPVELEQYGRKVVEKCRGLPLAIVATGSLLSFEPMDAEDWRKFCDKLNWVLSINKPEINWVVRVLNLSYTYLPGYLKNCFLYCSILPEDHLIRRKRLIRLWMAEGFIQTQGTKIIEVAEEYLAELIQRGMLQVVKRNEFDRVRRCRMHDLVRESTLLISQKEKFSTIYSTLDFTGPDVEVRRLSIQERTEVVDSSMNLPRLRSLLVFDTKVSVSSLVSSSTLRSSRYLRVLDLRSVPLNEVPDEIMNLFNLYHLCLRGTDVKKLPNSIRRLRNLRTLDMYNTKIGELPKGIIELKHLQHLFATKYMGSKSRGFSKIASVKAPRGLGILKNLQTLRSIEASSSPVREIGSLTQLSSLRIGKVKSKHCADLCDSLSKLHFLTTLDLHAYTGNVELQLQSLRPSLPRLRKLGLSVRLAYEMLDSTFFHSLRSTLTHLYLSGCRFESDPLPPLSALSNLSSLFLYRAYDGQRLSFQKSWFPKLRKLVLNDMEQVNKVEIEESAMVNLEYLELVGLKQLEDVPHGIKFLKSLRKLFLEDAHPLFKTKIKGEQRDLVQHIPKIILVYMTGDRRNFEKIHLHDKQS